MKKKTFFYRLFMLNKPDSIFQNKLTQRIISQRPFIKFLITIIFTGATLTASNTFAAPLPGGTLDPDRKSVV